MAYVIGTKGQVVIAKEIRDHLGVEPGWLTLQRVVGDHVEVHFLPPEHRKSLKGSLTDQVKVQVSPGTAWDKARETAWSEAARQKAEAREPAP